METIAHNMEGRRFIRGAAFLGTAFRVLYVRPSKYILIWAPVGP
jgi:hypothetical protein